MAKYDVAVSVTLLRDVVVRLLRDIISVSDCDVVRLFRDVVVSVRRDVVGTSVSAQSTFFPAVLCMGPIADVLVRTATPRNSQP